ncbi:hypothetical protein [Helicobacter sp.]|uniref:DUF6115 domain-containing protein n=1 Tax=Helicobacter sp. TaxID=218 RepID=UPI002588F326|nr:hypothetical protein [Helicobacter sp.]MCI7046797.1 NFACT family protein [Helicobacter sp.]
MLNDENIMLWIVIGIAAVFILFSLYLYFKERENTKRFNRYGHSIEELNKEVYRLQKKLKDYENHLEKFQQSLKQQIYQETRLEMKNVLDSNLFAQISPLKSTLQTLQEEWRDYQEKIDNKTIILEERIKEFAYTPSNPTNIDEGRIISMYKDGWSVDSIAKELRVGKGEVEFTLKFANLD